MEVKTIKKLEVPQEFRKEGYNHKLVKFQSGVRDVAIYEVIKENWQFGSGHRGWEVLVIKYATKDTEYFGSVRPAGTAILPTSEQFGHYGWHSISVVICPHKMVRRSLARAVRAMRVIFCCLIEEILSVSQMVLPRRGKGGKKSSVIFI